MARYEGSGAYRAGWSHAAVAQPVVHPNNDIYSSSVGARAQQVGYYQGMTYAAVAQPVTNRNFPTYPGAVYTAPVVLESKPSERHRGGSRRQKNFQVTRFADEHHEPERSWGTDPAVKELVIGHSTAWMISPYSYQIVVSSEQLIPIRRMRGSISTRGLGDILHDLLASSFVPLTEHRMDPDEIANQAKEFLSSFSDNTAVWKVDVGTIPFRQGQLIMGLTPGARDESVIWRFLRFRFPLVRFEWQVETPHAALSALITKERETVEIKVMWKAWARSPVSSGLVGYGFCVDTLTVTEGNYPVIKKRIFQVTNILHPELMTPVPYPNKVPQLSAQDDFMIFSTSQTMIQILQSSRERMALLVAFSALFTSLKPIVDKYSLTGGWVLTGVGIVAATISIVAFFAGWMLNWIDANSAKHRQFGAEKKWEV